MWDKLKRSLFGGKKNESAEVVNEQREEEVLAPEESSQHESALLDDAPAAKAETPLEEAAVEVAPVEAEAEKAPEAANIPAEDIAPHPEALVPDAPEEPAMHAVTVDVDQDAVVVEVVPEANEPKSEPLPDLAKAEVAEAANPDALPEMSLTADRDVTQDSVVEEDAPVPEAASVVVDAPKEQEKPRRSFFERIKSGLSRTKANLTEGLASLFLGAKQIDDDLLEELETQLLLADVGMEATQSIVKSLTERVSRKELKEPEALFGALKEELRALLGQVEQPLELDSSKRPTVILMVGVNGVGKTTTIGKLAKKYQGEGKKVMLAAGDTFRAAAVEQLQVWGERNKVPVIAQHSGADSAAVLYDALQAAKARGMDVLIADTAGRLQNKQHLMIELEKVVRVMRKLDPEAPHEVMLVLDAGTGQNAISQAKTFMEAVGVSGITLTKLDGTAKGGIIFAIAKQFSLPIRYIGVGEGIEDLRPFKADEFVDALFERNSS
ncbi:signal recognition particle-docking protein FtsY [Pokkaliibacter sp. CJK22405]|uniref:signal recognition particle-docking protein FtsY n=1 Tax=Pokkaliibacter sp. CJK22405 TaxID=3384615 RepID=UPI00398525A3